MRLSKTILSIMLIMIVFTAGCSKDETEDVRIPYYPGAVEDQGYSMGGMAQVKRLWTTDSYEEVLSYYREALVQYSPEFNSYEPEGSRQTEIKVVDEKTRVISVVVQEFDDDDRVAIVYMSVSL